MRNLLKCLLAATAFLSMSKLAEAADGSWGAWTDSGKKYVYAFLGNNELKFFKIGSTRWSDELQKNIHSWDQVDGVWEYRPGSCWLGTQKQQAGNLMIYVDSLQCCMSAQFFGKKLVLSEVWVKGVDTKDICVNRVLTKSEIPITKVMAPF